jgi:hypothetical protein
MGNYSVGSSHLLPRKASLDSDIAERWIPPSGSRNYPTKPKGAASKYMSYDPQRSGQ